MAEKKNNMATRFCDEILKDMRIELAGYRSGAKMYNDQADVLEDQIGIIKETLAKGNYENGKTE